MSRTVKIVLGVVVLVVLVGVAAFFLSKSAGSGPVIKSATVTQTNLGVTVAASGKVSAGLRADVYPPAAGILAQVYVKNGQAVKAGQRLGAMDTGPLKLAVKQAKAGIAQAEAGLAQIDQQVPSCLDEKAAKAAVDAAKAQYDAAKGLYDFLKDSRSSVASVTTAKISFKQARAGLLSAKATVVKVERGEEVSAQRDSANAAISSARAAYDVAVANLNSATLVAPVSGTVFFNPVGAAGADGQAPQPAEGVGVAPQAAPFSVAD